MGRDDWEKWALLAESTRCQRRMVAPELIFKKMSGKFRIMAKMLVESR